MDFFASLKGLLPSPGKAFTGLQAWVGLQLGLALALVLFGSSPEELFAAHWAVWMVTQVAALWGAALWARGWTPESEELKERKAALKSLERLREVEVKAAEAMADLERRYAAAATATTAAAATRPGTDLGWVPDPANPVFYFAAVVPRRVSPPRAAWLEMRLLGGVGCLRVQAEDAAHASALLGANFPEAVVQRTWPAEPAGYAASAVVPGI